MYIIIANYIRPSAEVSFYSGSSKAAANKVKALHAKRAVASGFVKNEIRLSDDKLTMTVTTTWENEDSFKAYRLANQDQIDELVAARLKYETRQGISRVVHFDVNP